VILLVSCLVAWAEPTVLGLVPAEGGTVAACTADPAASCWDDALKLGRFAPRRGAVGPAVVVDVRLAREGGDLLVRARDLSADGVLELYLRTTNAPAQQLRVRAADGVQRFTLAAPLGSPDRRSLLAELRIADRTLAWAPSGPPRATATLLFVGARAPHPAPTAHLEDGRRLVVAAEGAELKLTEEQVPLERGEPWSITSLDRVAGEPPEEGGWVEVEALWRDQRNKNTDLSVWRVWVPEIAAPDMVLAHGIHPAPSFFSARPGAPFAISERAAIVTDPAYEHAAALLGDELGRRFGKAPPVESGRPQPGDLWIGRDGAFPWTWAPQSKAYAKQDGGFAIAVGARGAAVLASTVTGATYGALALADLLGRDGTTAAMVAADAPVLARRLFHWDLGINQGRVPELVDFLRRAVARGRYNEVALELGGGYRFPSHPELAPRVGIDEEGLRTIVREGEALGLRMIPSLDTPGHSEWIIERKPELAEDTSGSLLCTRHPALRPLLADLYGDLLRAFGRPTAFHIAFDEIGWQSSTIVLDDQRCSRCASTPRFQLLLDHLVWNLDWFKANGIGEVMAWSDMFVPGWNGIGGVAHMAHVLPVERRKELTLISWSPRGDSIETLAPLGYRMFHGATGYSDRLRQDLQRLLGSVVGECLAVFSGTPWDAWSGTTGSAAISFHWPSVIMAGATAWRPALADTPLEPLFDAVRGSLSYAPGWKRLAGRVEALTPTGTPGSDDAPVREGPTRIEDVSFAPGTWLQATMGASIDLHATGKAAGISLLQGALVDHDAELRLKSKARNTRAPVAIATMRVVAEDGTTVDLPLRLGRETFRTDTPRAFLWDAAGSVRLSSPSAHESYARAGDVVLYRWDGTFAAPVAIRSATVEVTEPGVALLVAGASIVR
jgi:hypothetical protein